MKRFFAATAALALATSVAGAQVTGAQLATAPAGPFLAFSGVGSCTPGPCTLGPGVATIVGGSIYNASVAGVAARPMGTIGNFLAAGPVAGQPATLTFTVPATLVSFLWGSPDTYNQLVVTHTGGSTTFTAAGLGLSPVTGNQSYAPYVQFAASAGTVITGLTFNNVPASNAFEVSNFNATVVPEPSTYALLATGLAGLAAVARKRKRA